MSDERKISERYRSLSREEPPRHLDEAILAAARRAAATRPAPLVVPSGRQRWYFPLAAAAIIVLAVAVTMHVEREQPDPEAQVVAPATEPEAAAKEHASKPGSSRTELPPPAAEPPRVFAPDPKPAPSQDQGKDERKLGARRDSAPLADLQKAAPPTAAPPSPQPDAAGRANEPARAAETQQAPAAARSRQALPAAEEARAGALSGAIANYATMPPEQVLQGIADLRRQGRHDEADKALAEFRKRYPDYQISEEMRAKVERR